MKKTESKETSIMSFRGWREGRSLVWETLDARTDEEGRWYPKTVRVRRLFEDHLRVRRTPPLTAARALERLPNDVTRIVLRMVEDYESCPRDRVLTEMVHHFAHVFAASRETRVKRNLYRTIRSSESPFPWLRRDGKERGRPMLLLCRLAGTGLAYCRALVRWYYGLSEERRDEWWDEVNAFGLRKLCPENFFCGVSPELHLRIFSGFHNMTTSYIRSLLSNRFNDDATRASVAPFVWRRWDGTSFVSYESYAVRRLPGRRW